MEITAFLNGFLEGISNPFFIGAVSSVTPCAIAIFPIFLYRFGFWNQAQTPKKNYFGLLMASFGFLLSFSIAGLFLQQIILSSFANVLRIVLGTVIFYIGVLQLMNRLNLQTVSKFTNPFLLGGFLPWMLSFSPCVLFFSSVLITNASGVSAAQQGNTAFQFFLFALGMLTPVVIFVLSGNGILKFIQQTSGKVFGWFEKISAWLILFSGLYLGLQLVQVVSSEIFFGGIALMLFAIVFIVRVERNQKISGAAYLVLALIAIAMVISLIISIGITIPYDELAVTGEELLNKCVPGQHDTSPVALPVAILFSLNALALAVWYRLLNYFARFKLIIPK